MKEFDPPISSRETEDLILIANSTDDEWQQEAIDQARKELRKRGVSRNEEEKVLREWENFHDRINAALEEQLADNETESYSSGQMLRIFLGAPLYISGRLMDEDSLSDLHALNYKKKFRQRIILLLSGILFWIIMFIAFFNLSERQRLKKIDQTDIRQWEENYTGGKTP